MPARHALGGLWEEDDDFYKHLYKCDCGWMGAIISNNMNPNLTDAKRKHDKQVECKNSPEHLSCSETSFGHPDNFKDDTHGTV